MELIQHSRPDPKSWNMRGKNAKLITTAVARELCGFIWDIAQQIEPTANR